MLLLPTPHLLYSTVGPQTRFAASERCSSQAALTRLCGRISIGSGGFTLIRPFLQDTGIANPRQYRHYMPAPNALFISRRFLTLLPHSFVYLSITQPRYPVISGLGLGIVGNHRLFSYLRVHVEAHCAHLWWKNL